VIRAVASNNPLAPPLYSKDSTSQPSSISPPGPEGGALLLGGGGGAAVVDGGGAGLEVVLADVVPSDVVVGAVLVGGSPDVDSELLGGAPEPRYSPCPAVDPLHPASATSRIVPISQRATRIKHLVR